MGVQARITLYAESPEFAERAAAAAFARIAALEQIASDYRPTSELMRLCAAPHGTPVAVSQDLWRLLERSHRVARESEGAFDITVGPLVALWRASRRSGQLPAETERSEALERTGWRKLALDRRKRTATLRHPDMRLDLGGIAKGDACDQAVLELKRLGAKRSLVEMGGDIVAGEAPPGQKGWRIEVPGQSEQDGVIYLRNRAVSTSGSTEQFVEIGDVRYSHIVDPRTGLGLTTLTMATVVARDGLTSDSLATALCVLGDTRKGELLRRYPGLCASVRTNWEGEAVNEAACPELVERSKRPFFSALSLEGEGQGEGDSSCGLRYTGPAV
jgi:thiamine biosynthesis lipoprotein